MEFYKEFLLYVTEIIVAIFIIIFGKIVWNNFDNSDYETAKIYDNIKAVELNNIVDDDSNLLYLHNISKTSNDTDLIIKIDKNNDNNILLIDDVVFDLDKLDYVEDNEYKYITLSNYSFDKYETKVMNIKFNKI